MSRAIHSVFLAKVCSGVLRGHVIRSVDHTGRLAAEPDRSFDQVADGAPGRETGMPMPATEGARRGRIEFAGHAATRNTRRGESRAAGGREGSTTCGHGTGRVRAMAVPAVSPMKLLFTRPKNRLQVLFEGTDISCEATLPDGKTLRFGSEPPKFRLVFHSWKPLRAMVDEFSFGRSYVEGEIEIEGDMMSMLDAREAFQDSTRLGAVVRFWSDLLLRKATSLNKEAVDWHYSFGDDFFHTFTDARHHFYSHGVFHSENESIEQASEHKLEQMFEALELEPGKHLLDIGGGWGPVTRYCCDRGIRVSTVTIAPDSYAYIDEMIRANGYQAEVFREDFLDHRPAEPYDAIVIYGVIEHIPRYRRFARRAWECLRPNGRLYLDASAAIEKYDVSNFTTHYIWRGTHSFMCLQNVIRELLFHGFDLIRVKDETRDYELTMREWATRFEANRDTIVERWDERVYRAFRMYLWAACHAMRVHDLQAYHLVARRRADPGPRPGNLSRLKSFVAGLA